jgi:hypothetical protein
MMLWKQVLRLRRNGLTGDYPIPGTNPIQQDALTREIQTTNLGNGTIQVVLQQLDDLTANGWVTNQQTADVRRAFMVDV